MKKKHYALLLTLAIFVGSAIMVTTTTKVFAWTQEDYERKVYFLEKTTKEDPAEYAEYAAGVVAEIERGSVTTEMIKTLIDSGYLPEYKEELISKGYYVPVSSSQESISYNYSAVFDSTYYYNKYPDLQKTVGTDATSLLNHFITIGMSEGRQGSEEFNLAIYKKKNPDLVAVYGDNNISYYMHYITSGKAEQRIAR